MGVHLVVITLWSRALLKLFNQSVVVCLIFPWGEGIPGFLVGLLVVSKSQFLSEWVFRQVSEFGAE